MHPIIRTLLRSPTAAQRHDTLAEWLPSWQALVASGQDAFALALAGGHAADRVAWATSAGYQAALRSLYPEQPAHALLAMCATEAGGNRPRDIQTRFVPQADGSIRIDGRKSWVTLGSASTHLFVIGALPGAGGDRLDIRVALVPASATGVRLEDMAPLAFTPEVPHARLALEAVTLPADALLPGDAYEGLTKPFRTVEDIHISAAVLAYLLREARQQQWPPAYAEALVATLCLLGDLAAQSMTDAAVHVALAGALNQVQGLYREAGELWQAGVASEAALRWQRDAALFGIAGKVRQLRAERAWQKLASS